MGRRKLITDEQLLKIAREEFLRNGAFGSTKEIARQAGISEAALFKRYPAKVDLFLAAMLPEEVNIESIIRSATKETDPRRVLTKIGVQILAYFRKLIPVVMHLITHPSVSMTDVSGHFKSMPSQELAEALAAHFREANSYGVVKVENPLATATLFVSAIHSLAVFELMEIHGGRNMDHAVKPFVEALWSGMAPECGKSRTAQSNKNTHRC